MHFAVHEVELDSLQIREDEETLSVPAVITREDVYTYEDIGDVYLPKEELGNVAFTAAFAPIVEDHPAEIIVVNPDLVRGRLTDLEVEYNRVKSNLIFFKQRCSPKYLIDIRSAKVKSVSIGFFFNVIKKSGDFNGKHYEFMKKNMFIDHLAAGDFEGRCAYPSCGIGVDSIIGLDPYPNEHACRLRDPKTLDIVGSEWRKHKGKRYRVIFGKPKGKPNAPSVEQAYRYPTKEWSEAEAREHCKNHKGEFHPASGSKDTKESKESKKKMQVHREKCEPARRTEDMKVADAKDLLKSTKKGKTESADALIAQIKALVKELKTIG